MSTTKKKKNNCYSWSQNTSPSLSGSQTTLHVTCFGGTKHCSAKPPVFHQFGSTDEDLRPSSTLEHYHLASSQTCFCAVECAAQIPLSQILLRNALLTRAGGRLLSVISVAQTLMASPFSSSDMCLGSEFALFHLTEKPAFPTLASS